jgi:beta-lactamase regulating signal transducer with metallopeptidase domain
VAGLIAAGCSVGIWLASPWLRAAVVLPASLLVLQLAVQGRRHAQLARALHAGSLPGSLAGIPVRWRPFRSQAVVAGLRHPAIYCHPRLRESLTPDELHAVVLHEHHHQLRRDPVRLLVLAALEPVLRALPAGRRWIERRRAGLEVAADRFALRHGARRADLARAILRLAAAPTAAAGAGFVSATELRLRALVADDRSEPPPGWSGRARWLLLSAGVLAACGLAVTHHLLTVSGSLGCTFAGC